MPKRLLAAASVLASVILLIGTVLLIRGGVLRSRQTAAYRFALRDAIYALEQGRETQAQEELREAAASARSEGDWLSLLKESRRLDDRKLYRELLEAGLRAERESEPLTAAYALELLRDGRGDEAWELISDELDPDAYPALYTATLLAGGGEQRGDEPEMVALFAALADAEGPEPFLRAYEETGDVAFLQNALLLTLERGELSRAAELLRRFDPAGSEDQQGLRLLLMAAHTIEERDLFYITLERLGGRAGTRPEPLLLQADLRMSAGEYAEAERIYEELRRVAPGFSHVPYVNGAWLRHRKGLEAVDMLSRARERFPDEPRIQTALLKELIHVERLEEATVLMAELEPYLWTKLLRLAFFSDTERGFTARLWQLLNEEGNPKEAARLLAYHLVGVNDLAELERLLRRFPAEEHPWARFYLGYLALRRGRYGRADELLSAYPEAGAEPLEPWLWEANAALAALYTGSYERALERARRGREILVSAGEERSSTHGTLLTIEAEALRLTGSRDAALRVAIRAVSLAPESTSARLVLRNLERLR